VATAIEQWHEQDDTLGHRKLAVLLKTGKNRVKRVMKKYGIAARRKKKRYIYPGKASSIAPNLLRDPHTPADQEVMFSDIFEIHLADRTKVCAALHSRNGYAIASRWRLIIRCVRIWWCPRSSLLSSRFLALSFIRIKAANMERSRRERRS